MKFKFIYTALFVCITFLSVSARYIDPRTEFRLNKISERTSGCAKVPSTLREYIPVLIEVSDEKDARALLDSIEAVVYYSRANIYLASIPEEHIGTLAHFRSVDGLYAGMSLEPSVDVARQYGRVDRVHKGVDNFGPYTGRGVVTGICDVGFDPRHSAFNGRIGRWVVYDEYHGIRKQYDSLDDAPLTDDENKTHGTHVANILAGYDPKSPFNGVAVGSTFIPTMSCLTDVGILAGIEDIIAFAKSIGAPAVVNISAGSYLGPHDGCDLVGRYLTQLSDDAVICFSAGNYGMRNNCLSLELDKYSQPVGSAFCDYRWTGYDVYGATDLWSADDKQFELRLRVIDIEKKCDIFVSDWVGGGSNAGSYELPLDSLGVFEPDSYVWLGWNVNPHNNRFFISAEYDYQTKINDGSNPWARYFVAFQVRRTQPETLVNVYADGVLSFLHANGGLKGNGNGSISNLACCPDVVAVGGYQTRSIVPDIMNGQFDWGLQTDCVGSWSSYGLSGDGRQLPHFAAPGNVLVSALSGPYYAAHPDVQRVCFESDGNRWYAEGGTSMASPFVAGVFALWLEADPTLTVHELCEIAVLTANRNFADISDPRWGAGAIDAVAGLREVELRKAGGGVGNLTVGNSIRPHISVVAGHLDVYWAGVPEPMVKIFALSGMELNKDDNLNDGFYIVTVTDPRTGRTFTEKIIL